MDSSFLTEVTVTDYHKNNTFNFFPLDFYLCLSVNVLSLVEKKIRFLKLFLKSDHSPSSSRRNWTPGSRRTRCLLRTRQCLHGAAPLSSRKLISEYRTANRTPCLRSSRLGRPPACTMPPLDWKRPALR